MKRTTRYCDDCEEQSCAVRECGHVKLQDVKSFGAAPDIVDWRIYVWGGLPVAGILWTTNLPSLAVQTASQISYTDIAKLKRPVFAPYLI